MQDDQIGKRSSLNAVLICYEYGQPPQIQGQFAGLLPADLEPMLSPPGRNSCDRATRPAGRWKMNENDGIMFARLRHFCIQRLSKYLCRLCTRHSQAMHHFARNKGLAASPHDTESTHLNYLMFIFGTGLAWLQGNPHMQLVYVLTHLR